MKLIPSWHTCGTPTCQHTITCVARSLHAGTHLILTGQLYFRFVHESFIVGFFPNILIPHLIFFGSFPFLFIHFSKAIWINNNVSYRTIRHWIITGFWITKLLVMNKAWYQQRVLLYYGKVRSSSDGRAHVYQTAEFGFDPRGGKVFSEMHLSHAPVSCFCKGYLNEFFIRYCLTYSLFTNVVNVQYTSTYKVVVTILLLVNKKLLQNIM